MSGELPLTAETDSTDENETASPVKAVQNSKKTRWSQTDEELLFLCDRGLF
jgi:hypothetical protein